ncbi:MAG TPA: PRC-barrel domain-containing protein [Opitutus sp.]|nr:PRC-barrel domain-containing protein [Opitutus sp.]
MNPKKITSLIAISSLLPIAAWSQTSGSGSSGRSSNSGSSATQSSGSTSNSDWQRQNNASSTGTTSASGAMSNNNNYNSGKRDRASTGSAMNSGSASQWDHSSAAGGVASIQRVKQDDLENRLTAESVIGKDVVDRDGNKIGTIKDIGLASVLPSSLQDATNRTAMSGSSTAPRTSGTSASTGSSMASQGEAKVYISVGGFLGMGDDLVAVPASQLRRDSTDRDNFRLDVTQDQIKSIADRDSGYSAAE